MPPSFPYLSLYSEKKGGALFWGKKNSIARNGENSPSLAETRAKGEHFAL
jgi:hypothetical protein